MHKCDVLSTLLLTSKLVILRAGNQAAINRSDLKKPCPRTAQQALSLN